MLLSLKQKKTKKMSRFINPVPQFFLNDGSIASSGKLEFFENGDYSTQKNTYNDSLMTIANTNPVSLDGQGRMPSCFGSGLYSVKFYAYDNTQPGGKGSLQWTRDDVDLSGGGGGAFIDWSAVVTYPIGSLVKDGDNYYILYGSTTSLGERPSTTPTEWEQVAFLTVFNDNKTYSEDEVIIYNGFIYRSLVNGNNDTPPSANWGNLTFNNSIVGSFSVSEGISLGNTENANPNILDWYEEVSPPMTPVVIGSSTPGVGTYTLQVSRETRIGNTVHFTIYVQWTAHTGTGNLLIGTLKYDAETYTSISVTPLSGISPGAGRQLCAWIPVGDNKVYLNYFDSSTGVVADLPMDTAGAIMVSGSYIRQP
jgi:hypothetical protein